MKRSTFLGLFGTTVFSNPIFSMAGALLPNNQISIEGMKRSVFENHLNSQFIITNQDETRFQAELVEVSDGFHRSKKFVMPAHQREDRFTMLFRAPLGTTINQHIHTFSHRKLGKFDLFLTPTRWENDGEYFEVVINKIIPIV